MLFHSQLFLLIFLPLTFIAYRLAARLEDRLGPRPRQIVLLVASLCFYGYWDVRLLPLLVVSVLVNWSVVALTVRHRQWLVPAAVVANLAVLGWFKYANFFADALSALGGMDHQPWSIALPLGISFFTFQQISYLVDVRRGQAPAYTLLDYALYVSFFPQLIAGPIVRHDQLIPQFATPARALAAEQVARGLTWLTIGLCKKVFLADPLGDIADPLFGEAVGNGSLTFAESWIGAFAFAGQIYFDFSGYSDMALGLALMFGFTLPLNFDAPYRATSISAFWRRWHMTLMSFLRDYVYVPLGGSRRGRLRLVRNILIAWFLSGLWHGAGWTFIAWGLAHGIAMVVERAWRWAGLGMPVGLGWLLTFVFAVAAFVVFRTPDLGDAALFYGRMLGSDGLSMEVRGGGRPIILLLAYVVILTMPTSQRLVRQWLWPSPWLAAVLGVALLAVVMQVGIGANEEFIYFQF